VAAADVLPVLGQGTGRHLEPGDGVTGSAVDRDDLTDDLVGDRLREAEPQCLAPGATGRVGGHGQDDPTTDPVVRHPEGSAGVGRFAGGEGEHERRLGGLCEEHALAAAEDSTPRVLSIVASVANGSPAAATAGSPQYRRAPGIRE
jgi:hypothetical protein